MMTARHTGKIIALGIVLLFFLQVLADFIEHVYVFGLLGTSIPPEIVAVLFLLTPFLLMGRHRLPGKRYLITLLALLFIARLLEPILPTRGRMLLAGAGVGAFMLWLPAQLLTESGAAKLTRVVWTGATMIAVLLSVTLRSWGWGLISRPWLGDS